LQLEHSVNKNRDAGVGVNRNANFGGGRCHRDGNYDSGPDWEGVAASVAVSAMVSATAHSAAVSPPLWHLPNLFATSTIRTVRLTLAGISYVNAGFVEDRSPRNGPLLVPGHYATGFGGTFPRAPQGAVNHRAGTPGTRPTQSQNDHKRAQTHASRSAMTTVTCTYRQRDGSWPTIIATSLFCDSACSSAADTYGKCSPVQLN